MVKEKGYIYFTVKILFISFLYPLSRVMLTPFL